MKIYVDVIVQISYSTLHILHPTANIKHITSLLAHGILLWTLYMMYNLLYNNAIYSWFRNPPRRRHRRRHSHNKSKIHFHNMYISDIIMMKPFSFSRTSLHSLEMKHFILYFYELQSTAPALLNQPLWHWNEGECWMHDYGVQRTTMKTMMMRSARGGMDGWK